MRSRFFCIFVLVFMLCSCTMKQQSSVVPQPWNDRLADMMPYLGHRNWIVIADMAYPLQSGNGVVTLWADEPYEKVLKTVKDLVDDAPHVFAHIYRDRELSFIPETDAPGITDLRHSMDVICGDEAITMPHEELISRLDAAGELFTVVIVKTRSLIPYTTTFFELDCGYWDAARADRLADAISKEQ